MTGNPLPADKLRVALQRIAAWRLAPADPVACPVCEAAGLVIVDRSTRPYAEWYALYVPLLRSGAHDPHSHGTNDAQR